MLPKEPGGSSQAALDGAGPLAPLGGSLWGTGYGRGTRFPFPVLTGSPPAGSIWEPLLSGAGHPVTSQPGASPFPPGPPGVHRTMLPTQKQKDSLLASRGDGVAGAAQPRGPDTWVSACLPY